MLVLGCRIGAVLDEEPGQIHINPFGHLIVVVCEASCEVFVLGERSKRAVLAGTSSVNKMFRLLDRCYLAYL